MEQLLTQLKESWEMHKTAWLIGLVLVLGGGGYWYHQTTSAPPVLPQRQSAPVKSAPGSAAPANTGKVVVDVKGAVNHPGVYTLAKSQRVQEAIKAAGGQTPAADMRQVNLAKQLVDQQVVYVPSQGEQVATPLDSAGAGGGTAADQEKINLNQATKEDLMKISGIGDKKADKILAYRQSHGQFKTIEELQNVDGFGEKTVAKLKDQLAV